MTLFTLSIFVIGVWSLSFYASNRLEKDIKRELGVQQQSIVKMLGVQINDELRDRLMGLNFAASKITPEMMRKPSMVQKFLDDRLLLVREFNGGVFVTSLDGTAIASVPDSVDRVGVNYADRDYIRSALFEDRPMVGQPTIGRALKLPVFGISVPIHDKNGKVIGAFAGINELRKSNFLEKITEHRYGKAGYFLLEEQNTRLIISSTDKKRVMQYQAAPGKNKLIDRHLAGSEETGITTNAAGVEVIASANRIPLANWMLVAALPTSEALAPINQIANHIKLASLLMSILAGVITWWILRRELAPLFDSIKNLSRLETESRYQFLPVSGRDEISGLIRSFNRLLKKLWQREDALKDSEFRWKFAIEGSGDGLWDWDLVSNKVFFSKTWKEMLGYSEDEVSDDLSEWEKRVHPDDKKETLAAIHDYFEGKTPLYVNEHRVFCKNGDYKWILDRGLIVSRDEGGKPLRMIGTHSDVTERRNQEDARDLRNRALEMLAAAEPLDKTLLAIITGIEKLHPEMLCSILLLDGDTKRLKHCVAPSLPDFYNAAVDGIEMGVGQGSCGTSAFTGERVIVNDIATHPSWAAYKAVALRAELRSCWSQPIRSANQTILGTFAIYHRYEHTPTKTDINLIEQSANLVSIAIDKNIDEYNLRIAAIAFESQKGMLVTDASNRILRVNQQFTAITGYSPDDVIGKTPQILSSGRQDKYFYEEMWRSIQERGYWEGEIWNQRKNGETYQEFLTINTVKDKTGVVTNYVASFDDITLAKEASAKIHNLAFYDLLTKLPNRRLLIDRLEHALASSTKTGKKGALLLMDLDHFKTLNDTLGHEVGDLLLKDVATRLNEHVREGDTVARMGGDEFLILLEDLHAESISTASQAEVIAKEILDDVAKPFQLGVNEYYTTASIGAVVFNDHEASIEDLMKQVDIAMYRAKDSGRNTLCFFDPKMQETISARASLEQELRYALEKKQFELYYQIQVDNDEKRLGVEALIRWQHPVRGTLSPIEFIPLAEASDLILPIGEWVINQACAQLKSWQENEKAKDLTISINVTAKQFLQPNFIEVVERSLSQFKVNPTLLKLELTESTLLQDLNKVISTMAILKRMGIRFELDDFGTGYSSLQYLKKLPLDQLKIDQSFVRDIEFDSSDKSLVLAIINMAHSLELEVIAEGVETEAQFNFLRENGCDHYQGYLFSKPIPIQELELSLK